MSLCYLNAAKKREKGEISEEQYFHYLFLHCGGERHPGDRKPKGTLLQATDAVAHLVQRFAKNFHESPVEDIKPFEDVFAAYRSGDPAEVMAKLKALGEHEGDVRTIVAQVALRDRNPSMLKMCMDAGVSFGQSFAVHANRVDREQDPETYYVLERDPKFRSTWSNRDPRFWWDQINW